MTPPLLGSEYGPPDDHGASYRRIHNWRRPCCCHRVGPAGSFERDAQGQVEDSRRWLLDRRAVYAKYLALAEVMLREIDGVATFLSYDGDSEISDEDDDIISEGLTEYFITWNDSLQPLLGEIQLLATNHVADLADRVSGAMMEITWRVEKRHAFTSYYPAWFQAQDLLHVLRDAMRAELGLPVLSSLTAGPREDDWPWLNSRPSYESYIQQHLHRSTRPSAE